MPSFDSILSSIGGVGNLFGGVMSGISGQQALDWLRGAYTNNLNYGREQANTWGQNWWNTGGAARENALNAGNNFGPMVNGGIAPYMDAASGLAGRVPGLMDQYGGPFQSGQTDAGAAGLEDILRQGADIFGGGGWSPEGRSIFNQGDQMATGQNDPMRALTNIGQNFLNTGGRTGFNQQVQDRAGETLDAGGMTDVLRRAFEGALGIAGDGGKTDYSQAGIQQLLNMLKNGGETAGTRKLDDAGTNALTGNLGVAGLTTTGAAGELAALQGIQAGGSTALTKALQLKAREILAQDPTLTLEQAVSMARDAAATAAGQQGKTLRARALARGGGPGGVVASGSQNDAMADFADQMMQAEAGAGRDALMKQQGVLGEEQKLGASLGLGAGDLEKDILGTYSSLLGGLEGVAANRFSTGGDLLGKGTALATDRAQVGSSGIASLGSLETQRLLQALGLLPQIQGAATSNAGTMGGLGMAGDTSQINRVNSGTNMLSEWLRSAIGGSNISNNALNSAQNFGLGAGNLSSGAANNLGSLGLGTGNLGQNRFNNLFGAVNAGINTQGNALNTGIRGQSDLSTNPLLQLGGQTAGLVNTFGNNASQLPGMQGTNTSWNALAGGGR